MSEVEIKNCEECSRIAEFDCSSSSRHKREFYCLEHFLVYQIKSAFYLIKSDWKKITK